MCLVSTWGISEIYVTLLAVETFRTTDWIIRKIPSIIATVVRLFFRDLSSLELGYNLYPNSQKKRFALASVSAIQIIGLAAYFDISVLSAVYQIIFISLRTGPQDIHPYI